MRRLATQIHATVIAVLALFAVLVTAAWWLGPGGRAETRLAEGLAATAADVLPGPDRPTSELQAVLERLAPRLGVDVAVFARDGRPLAGVGRPPHWPAAQAVHGHWVRLRGRSLSLALRLPDGRVLVAGRPHPDWQHLAGLSASVGLLALAVAVGAWPLVRRLTRRLENLRLRVDELGQGDLGVRAPVEGRDEVAALARSFNKAADRIQALVAAQKRQLAFASHELRSPLARLRVSLAMLSGEDAVKRRADADIAELDGLIEELLEASRLEAGRGRARDEEVDLLALAAEEAARVEAEVLGEPVAIMGDVRLLRRLMRNLLENARRHGGGEVEVRVAPDGAGGVRLHVADRGPGVPEPERESVFEPFHRPPGAPETGAGYGLGLALVRQIARAHGGEVTCRGRDGGGSLFEVNLPASPPRSEKGEGRRAGGVRMASSLAMLLACGLLALTALSCNDSAGGDEAGLARAREAMVAEQIAARGVKDPRTLTALRRVQRHLFVPPGAQRQAYDDHPLPIGHGQTISQPYIVAFMTEALELRGGEKVLEVGTGSGYQAAVLAEIASAVHSIEIVTALAAESAARLSRLGYANVLVRAGDGYQGWPEAAPFDAIMVTAAAPRIPEPLKQQLRDGGRLVIPLGDDWQELVRVRRRGNRFEEQRLLPVRFVPMTGRVRE